MPELFEDVSADEFALPTDADQIALKNAKAGAEPAEPVEETAAPEADAPAVERNRNADGTFAPNEPAEDTPVEETAADRLLAGNFKTTEDLERAYEDLRATYGRQSSELGDLRRTFDDRFAQLDQRLAAPQAAPVQITQDLIDQNPGYATVLAYEQGNGAALQIAFDSWKEEDPASAASWAATENAKQTFGPQLAAYEERLQQLAAQIAPAAEQTAQNVLSAKMHAAVAANPGLDEFVKGDKIGALFTEFPDIGNQIVAGTPDQKVQAATALFEIHRGRSADNLAVTQEQIARQTAQEAQTVREEAFVASASTASTGAKLSKADEIAAQWDALDKPYNDGWQV